MAQIPNFYNNEFAQTNQNNLQTQQTQQNQQNLQNLQNLQKQQQQTIPSQLISNMNPFNVNQAGSKH